MRPMRLLNLRIDDDLRDLVVRAAFVSTFPDLSSWAREALEAGAYRELEAAKRAKEARDAPRKLGLHRPFNQCVHPLPARREELEAQVCGLCGVVTRWKM